MILKIWILVLVKRGFIPKPEIFYTKKNAVERKIFLSNDFNQDYDELEIFEYIINL